MPAKIDDNTLTLRDLEIFQAHTIERKTLDETAQQVEVSRDTVKRTKRKKSYRDLVVAALEVKGFTVEDYASGLINLTTAQKEINVDGVLETVDDNPTRLGALKKIGDVYGDNAPKQLDLLPTGSTDEEINLELEQAMQELGLAEGPEQLGDGPDDSVPEDSTVL